MRDGRPGSGGAGATAAMAAPWALALIAGCASPRPPRPVFTPRSCPERPALVNRDLLRECVAGASADPAPSCVPAGHHGREIARDDEARLRAYEICVPESQYATTNRLRVDPGRVIVERTGEHPAGEEDLLAISLRLAPSPSRAPEPPNGRPPPPPEGPQLSVPPVQGTCWIEDGNGKLCLEMHLQGPPLEVASLLAAIAKWIPRGDACIAMQVDFGWQEGCPEIQPLVPQSALEAAR
jgi:hypothetical protein